MWSSQWKRKPQVQSRWTRPTTAIAKCNHSDTDKGRSSHLVWGPTRCRTIETGKQSYQTKFGYTLLHCIYVVTQFCHEWQSFWIIPKKRYCQQFFAIYKLSRHTNPSLGITVWHHEARQASWCQTDPRDEFFYLSLTSMIDSYNLRVSLGSISSEMTQ